MKVIAKRQTCKLILQRIHKQVKVPLSFPPFKPVSSYGNLRSSLLNNLQVSGCGNRGSFLNNLILNLFSSATKLTKNID